MKFSSGNIPSLLENNLANLEPGSITSHGFLKDFPSGLHGIHFEACINFGISKLCLLLA